MNHDKVWELYDFLTDLRVEIESVRHFADLMLTVYADPAPNRLAGACTLESVERFQSNMFTLFDLILKAHEDAQNAENLADEIYESYKSPA